MTTLDPLRPLPLSAAEITDLVARVRARPDFIPHHRPSRPVRPKRGTRCALAARFAFEHGLPIAQAARVHHLSAAPVALAFKRLYPGVSAWAHRRRFS